MDDRVLEGCIEFSPGRTNISPRGITDERSYNALEKSVKRMQRFTFQAIIICLALLVTPIAVQAIPPLPSSIYGTVKVNNANVVDGTLVEALINGQVVAHGFTETYQGDSVYTLDVPGDDGSTAAVEGGKEGDKITFRVGGVMASETGVWHGATNVMLNLTITSGTTLNTPQPTPTPVATQTPIIISYVTDLPTLTSTVAVMITQTHTAPEQTLSSAMITPSISSSDPAISVTGATSGNAGPNLVLIVILMAGLALAIVLLAFEIIRQRNKNDE
jgi:hypothetical protein